MSDAEDVPEAEGWPDKFEWNPTTGRWQLHYPRRSEPGAPNMTTETGQLRDYAGDDEEDMPMTAPEITSVEATISELREAARRTREMHHPSLPRVTWGYCDILGCGRWPCESYESAAVMERAAEMLEAARHLEPPA